MAGVTLIELMVVVAIVAVLAGAAVPSLAHLVDGMRRDAMSNEALAFLWLARSESIQRGVPTVVCPSSDGHQCDEAGNWAGGWMVFADTNADGRRDPGETILRLREALPHGCVMRGNTPVARYVAYLPSGRSTLVSGAFQAGTLSLCRPGAGTMEVSRIVLSATGRPRLESSRETGC